MAAILGGESIYLLLFLAGIGLLAGEALAPGAHFFVLGIALFTAGLVGMMLPGGLGILGPLILAIVVVGVTGATLWGYRRSVLTAKEGLAETSDSESLRGQFGYVTRTVTPKDGEVKLESGGFKPYFQARTTTGEIQEDEEVMVVDPGGGNVVTVEAVAGDDDIDRELAKDRERTTANDEDGEQATDEGEDRSADERASDATEASDTEPNQG